MSIKGSLTKELNGKRYSIFCLFLLKNQLNFKTKTKIKSQLCFQCNICFRICCAKSQTKAKPKTTHI